MVRNSQIWELGEPELNDRGQPIVHNIAQKLGCIRPNVDLPVHSIFPEDEVGTAELARQLKGQQQTESRREIEDNDSSAYRPDRASSSELKHSDIEQLYRKAASSSRDNGSTLSPHSFTGTNEFDFGWGPSDMDANAMFASQSPSLPNFFSWPMPKTTASDMTIHLLQQAGALQNMDVLNQGLAESSFGIIEPPILSWPRREMMMSMGDPVVYGGYDDEQMRL